jgi:hypothetical protein
VWSGDGLKREVFFFPSGDAQIYGSIFASSPLRRPYGLVLCSSWGIDADRLKRLLPRLAVGMAEIGGVAMLFDFPGHGDSMGRGDLVTVRRLVATTRAALSRASERYPNVTWIVGGALLGASIAALTVAELSAHHLLLLQPELDPPAYVKTVVRKARRRTMGVGDTEQTAFGYPIPLGVLNGRDATLVTESLEAFHGRGAVVRFSDPPTPSRMPEQFEVHSVPGTWRVAQRTYSELVNPTLAWLDRVTR